MKQYFDFTGKKAIVTGGSRGLGHAMAEALLEQGAQVCIWGSSKETLSAAEAFREQGYRCVGIRTDLADRKLRAQAFEESLKRLDGGLDILINCGGVQSRSFYENFPESEWDRVIEVNLNAVADLCQKAGRVMLERGGGKIINIASMLSFFGGSTVAAYAASKGGVAQLTKAIANEWAGKNINVNAIAPGYMDTEMNTALLEEKERYAQITARIPAHRWGTGEDMKGMALFLASDASSYVSGAIIPVDGGYLGR